MNSSELWICICSSACKQAAYSEKKGTPSLSLFNKMFNLKKLFCCMILMEFSLGKELINRKWKKLLSLRRPNELWTCVQRRTWPIKSWDLLILLKEKRNFNKPEVWFIFILLLLLGKKFVQYCMEANFINNK